MDKFRKLDLTTPANKERLIDSLVKCIIFYDDKLVITFNFKNEPVTVPASEEFDEIEKSSDIKAFAFFLLTRGRTNALGSNRLTSHGKCGIIYSQKILNLSLFDKNMGWLDNPLTIAIVCRRMIGGGEPI